MSLCRTVFSRFILAPLYGGLILGSVCGAFAGSVVACCQFLREAHFGEGAFLETIWITAALSLSYGALFGGPLGMKLGLLFSLGRGVASLHLMFVYITASTLVLGVPVAFLFSGNIIVNLYAEIAGSIAGFLLYSVGSIGPSMQEKEAGMDIKNGKEINDGDEEIMGGFGGEIMSLIPRK